MKGRVWFTIDIEKLAIEAGIPKDQARQFGKIVIRHADGPRMAKRPSPLKPPLSSIYVDENGQLRVQS